MTNKLGKLLFSTVLMGIISTSGIQFVSAASSQDMITNDGQVISADSNQKVDTPSQSGYNSMNNSQVISDKLDAKDAVPEYADEYHPESIIGTDDRRLVSNTKVFPYSAVVFLSYKFKGLQAKASGIMISPDTVLTAAHAVYSPGEQTWVTDIMAYPGRDKEKAPYGTAKGIKTAVPSEWINSKNDTIKQINNDIAMIRLDKPIGINTGWMGLSTNVSNGMNITTTGYPGDKLIDRQPAMWTESGKVLSINDKKVFYQLDSMGGQSGSAVYNDNKQVIAIHTNGGVTDNSGVRINSAVANWVNNDLNNTQSVYRLYNKNTGEHFYTKLPNEVKFLQNSGWTSEGFAWFAPATGNPVYRLYNPNNGGDHQYTMITSERNALIKAGWKDEGIAFYSDPNQKTPLYRLYNPNAKTGAHHYTTLTGERDAMIKAGWKYEGIGWYGL